MSANILTYVVARPARGLNIPTSLQVRAIKEYLSKYNLVLSLPITEWYFSVTYKRLLESIISGRYTYMCVYSLRMLPELNTYYHFQFVKYGLERELSIFSVLEDSLVRMNDYVSFLEVNYQYAERRASYSELLSRYEKYMADTRLS